MIGRKAAHRAAPKEVCKTAGLVIQSGGSFLAERVNLAGPDMKKPAIERPASYPNTGGLQTSFAMGLVKILIRSIIGGSGGGFEIGGDDRQPFDSQDHRG